MRLDEIVEQLPDGIYRPGRDGLGRRMLHTGNANSNGIALFLGNAPGPIPLMSEAEALMSFMCHAYKEFMPLVLFLREAKEAADKCDESLADLPG